MRNAVRTFIQGVGICLLATALWVPGVSAQTATAPQSWPSKPLRLVVPFPAGGAVDLLARLITPRLGESLGQPVVVDYRAGAGGNVGADLVAKSAADGYTMLLTANGHAIGPALYKKLPFSAERDFAPVTQVVATTFLLAGKPSGPIQSLRELLAAARARPASNGQTDRVKLASVYYSSGVRGNNGQFAEEPEFPGTAWAAQESGHIGIF